MPKLKHMEFGLRAFGECVKATFESRLSSMLWAVDLPKLRSIEFGIDSFKFNKHCYEDTELIMRSLCFLPPSQLDLPKLETCKVVSWISSTFVYLCNVTMEGAILFTIWWLDIPLANDVLFSPKAFKNVCDFTLKSIRSTTQVTHRHFTAAVEVLY